MMHLIDERDLFQPSTTKSETAAHSIAWLENWHRKVIAEWSDGARGWAPAVATEVLLRARLDRQLALCSCLRMFVEPPTAPTDASLEGWLILAWVNLGATVEGSLKFLLSVFAHDYFNNPVKRGDEVVEPDVLLFDQLRKLYTRTFWLPTQLHWDNWLLAVQRRRNAIHAYQDRDIGSHDQFLAAIDGFRRLVDDLDARLPSPY